MNARESAVGRFAASTMQIKGCSLGRASPLASQPGGSGGGSGGDSERGKGGSWTFLVDKRESCFVDARVEGGRREKEREVA